MKKKKVIIIGAGPAGLTAGYELLLKKEEYDVIILEADEQVGGISKTISYKGNKMDIGGHRFFSKDKKVNDFWQEMLPLQGSPAYDDKKLNRMKELSPNGPDPEKKEKVMLIRDRVSRIYYLRKFFDYPITMKKETFKNMGFLRTIESGFSYLKSMLFKKKEDSLENFYINRFGKKLYSMFFEKYTEKLWGRHPKDISADWGAQRVKGLSIIAVLKDAFYCHSKKDRKKETSLIEKYKYPKYGPGQLWETVAEKIEKQGGKIYLNSEVTKINIDKNRIQSVEYIKNSKRKILKGDIIISSMPLKDFIGFIHGKVPKRIKFIAKGLPYRDFITIGLLIKKMNLKNETNIETLGNIIPDCWIYIQESEVKLGRIQIFNNWSPYMVKDPENTIWLGLEYFCNERDDFWNKSENELVEFATKELISMNIINFNDVLDSHVKKVKKAYPAYFDTYEYIDELVTYLNNFDNLYCIGRNGQHRYNNMDHSMVTAFEAVNNIKNNISDKTKIWNVNTEKDYHEEKKGK